MDKKTVIKIVSVIMIVVCLILFAQTICYERLISNDCASGRIVVSDGLQSYSFNKDEVRETKNFIIIKKQNYEFKIDKRHILVIELLTK
jgi:hypothetical protein